MLQVSTVSLPCFINRRTTYKLGGFWVWNSKLFIDEATKDVRLSIRLIHEGEKVLFLEVSMEKTNTVFVERYTVL